MKTKIFLQSEGRTGAMGEDATVMNAVNGNVRNERYTLTVCRFFCLIFEDTHIMMFSYDRVTTSLWESRELRKLWNSNLNI